MFVLCGMMQAETKVGVHVKYENISTGKALEGHVGQIAVTFYELVTT